MGYPMTYQRFVNRNRLTGDYPDHDDRSIMAGDLRRLERNSRDLRHLDAYARKTGLTPEQVRSVLDTFFASDFPMFDFERYPCGEFGCSDTAEDAA